MLLKLIPLWWRYKFPFLLTKPPHFSDMGGNCPHISKFLESTLEYDFQADNLPEGKFIKHPPSTSKWYKLGQPCFDDKLQESVSPLSPNGQGPPSGSQRV